MTRYYYALIAIIGIGSIVAFDQAIDYVIHFFRGTPNTTFQAWCFWFFIISIAFLFLSFKYSVMRDPEDGNQDNKKC